MDDFGNIKWVDVGMRIDDLDDMTLEATIEQPIVLSKPAYDSHVIPHETKPKTPITEGTGGIRALYVVVIEILIIIVLVTAMCANAEAGMAFLRFEVFSVTEKTVIVTDEHEDFFTFDREDNIEVQAGDDVIVCTDMVWVGDGVWKWDTSRTAIIQNNGKVGD